jgi:competence ComEA-like helix-hairpin-helix protein
MGKRNILLSLVVLGFLLVAGIGLFSCREGWAAPAAGAGGPASGPEVRRAAVVAGEPGEFQRIAGCGFVATAWGDGDSFEIRLPDGSTRVIRLYGVDCFETDARDDSLARRLREQRAHFGIKEVGPAVKFGLAAKDFTAAALARPFVVHTRWSRAPGRSGLPRYYARVTTAAGRDLGEELVAAGLAWARGVNAGIPGGASADEYAARLADLESAAMLGRLGAWGVADPAALPGLRAVQRAEDSRIEAEKAAIAAAHKEVLRVDVNAAGAEELCRLPGVGEATAAKIIEKRPFKTPEDLLEVHGIGPAKLKSIRQHLILGPE